MKGSISYCLIVYVVGMLILLNLRPRCMLEDRTDVFKSWDTIDIENVESYFNIYVFGLVFAYLTFYFTLKANPT